MDIKNAFIYSLIEGEVYVNQPYGLNDRTARIYRLLRALYRLKQFLRIWYDILVVFFKSYEMSFLNADLSVYAKLGLIIVIFVDNLLITDSSISEIKVAKVAFYARF